MTTLDLHPEDLIDRAEAGTITEQERAMLDAHLARCAACRFEMSARQDFDSELGPMPSSERGRNDHDGALVRLAIERAAQHTPDPDVAREEAPVTEHAARALPRRNAPRRIAATVLVAASFLLASASFAAVRNGSFTTILRAVGIVTEPSTPVDEPSEVSKPSAARRVPNRQSQPALDPSPIETTTASAIEDQAPAPVPVPDPMVVAPPAPVPATLPKPPVVTPAAVPAPPLAPEPIAPQPVAAQVPTASTLFTDATAARRRGDHQGAVLAYRELLDKHASSPEAVSAKVAFGRLLLDDARPAEALALFQSYLEGGASTLREEALVGRARAFERLGRRSEERRAWNALLDAYPESIHAARARTRMTELE